MSVNQLLKLIEGQLIGVHTMFLKQGEERITLTLPAAFVFSKRTERRDGNKVWNQLTSMDFY